MQLATITLFNRSNRPCSLEVKQGDHSEIVAFKLTEYKRVKGEFCWQAKPMLGDGDWSFRIAFNDGTYSAPHASGSYDHHHTALKQLWIQHGQIFAYEPQPFLTEPRVLKIPNFVGSLPKRSLYIYLPRGYDQHSNKTYPVIYMHDGQNCFEQYVGDSFSGSWRADEAATRLIAGGQMQECIIVGVGNGGSERTAEYLPEYVVFRPKPKPQESPFKPIIGRANRTAAYYINELAPFIERHYRAATHRDQRAILGSSMGGLFTTYLAWEQTDFARHHAALSTSFWITRQDDKLTTIERLRTAPTPDIRFWLDSGTQDSSGGDDGLANALIARDILLNNGFTNGDNFNHYKHEGAGHHESSWAARLPLILKFLFPTSS